MLCPPCCATARLLRAEAFKYLDIIVLLQFTIGFLIAHRPGCKQWAEDVGNNTERYIRIGFITVSDEIRPTQEVAIVKEGLQWDEQHQAIKIIFLMSMSIHDNEGLPVLTSAIIELVDNPKLQQDMIDCLTFTDFRTLFLNIK